MVIGTTTVPDYNNGAFFPPAGPHNTQTQGIFVWRVRAGDLGDYSTNGLIRASGLYDLTWPERIPYEADDAIYYPGHAGIRVLSPWSDSRPPVPHSPPTTGIFVPNTKFGTNVDMEIISENPTAGYIRIKLYATSPKDASPSKPQGLSVSIHTSGGSFPKLNWAANTEPDVNPNGHYVIEQRVKLGTWGSWDSVASASGSTTEWIDFSICNVGSGSERIEYRLRVRDTQLKLSVYSDVAGIAWTGATCIEKRGEQSASSLPTRFDVDQSYPNPFNPSTTIKFDLPEPGKVSLTIYDVLGRKVAELVNEEKEAGYHSITWNASDVASGVYLARFVATDANGYSKYSKINKLILMK